MILEKKIKNVNANAHKLHKKIHPRGNISALEFSVRRHRQASFLHILCRMSASGQGSIHGGCSGASRFATAYSPADEQDGYCLRGTQDCQCTFEYPLNNTAHLYNCSVNPLRIQRASRFIPTCVGNAVLFRLQEIDVKLYTAHIGQTTSVQLPANCSA